jgi:hypothetical protein
VGGGGPPAGGGGGGSVRGQGETTLRFWSLLSVNTIILLLQIQLVSTIHNLHKTHDIDKTDKKVT